MDNSFSRFTLFIIFYQNKCPQVQNITNMSKTCCE
nr:MAG TPA: hypothetical protein [Caudoviricetes sp.]